MIATVAGIVVGVTFLLAAATKIRDRDAWTAQARDLGAPRSVVSVLPWLELVLGALLVAQVARPVPAALAVVVLLAFSVLLAIRLAQGRHPPCACFGAWSAKPLGPGHLVRNAVLVVLALIAALA